jgi:hypothetical protein
MSGITGATREFRFFFLSIIQFFIIQSGAGGRGSGNRLRERERETRMVKGRD